MAKITTIRRISGIELQSDWPPTGLDPPTTIEITATQSKLRALLSSSVKSKKRRRNSSGADSLEIVELASGDGGDGAGGHKKKAHLTEWRIQFNEKVTELKELLDPRTMQDNKMPLSDFLQTVIRYLQAQTEAPSTDPLDYWNYLPRPTQAQVPVEWIGDLVFLVDRRGIIQKASPSCLRFMGANPSRLAGRSMFDFVHWSNVRQLQDALVTMLEHMHSDVTMYPVCVDGEHMTLLFAWCSPDQTAIGALTLQNSPPALPRLPRPSTSKGWCIHTPDGCITDVYSSANTDELFGYEFSRLQGTCLYALIHPDDIGHVSTLHTGSVRTRRVSLMYQRIQNRDGTWAMAKTLFIPCINKKTEAVEFCLSAISLECGDSEPMPSRAAECRLLEDKSPLVYGDVTQIRSLCEKAAKRAGEDKLSDDPWLTEAEASAIHHAIKCIDEATAQSDALFADPSPGKSQSRASDSHEAPTPQGHVGLLNSSPTSDGEPQPRDLMPKKGDSLNPRDVARDCMDTGKDSLGAKNTSSPPTKEKEKCSSEENGDTDMVALKSRNRRQKKKRETTKEGKGGLRNIVPRERLLLSIDVNSDTNTLAGLCAEAANRNDLFDNALSSYSVQITPRNQPFFPIHNNLNDGYLHPFALQPTQSLPSQSDSRNDLSWNASISTSSQNFSFSSQSNADLAQLLRQHITATNELVAANARSNLGLSLHPMSENPGLGLRQPICSMSAPTRRFLLPHSLAAAPARPIAGSVSDRVINPQDRNSAGDGTVLDCTLAKSGMNF